MSFDENPFTCHAKQKTNILKGFKFSSFIGRFQVTSRQCRGYMHDTTWHMRPPQL